MNSPLHFEPFQFKIHPSLPISISSFLSRMRRFSPLHEPLQAHSPAIFHLSQALQDCRGKPSQLYQLGDGGRGNCSTDLSSPQKHNQTVAKSISAVNINTSWFYYCSFTPQWLTQLCSLHGSLENDLNDRKLAVSQLSFPVAATSALGIPHCCLGWASGWNLHWSVFGWELVSLLPVPLFCAFRKSPASVSKHVLKNSHRKLSFQWMLIWVGCFCINTAWRVDSSPQGSLHLSNKPELSVTENKSLNGEQYRKGSRPQLPFIS